MKPMANKREHSISVVTPTLNSERVLKDCLESIFEQDYPKHLVEILVVDGGSEDATLQVAKEFQKGEKYRLRILPNPLKTGEAGKAVGVKYARHNIIAFIDSDNILPNRTWFRQMVAPFEDDDIIATEPICYTYRKEDGFINRYCALMGMNDPLCLFLGNYDRECSITGRWTGLRVPGTETAHFIRIRLEDHALPTIGANGFMIRRSALKDLLSAEYLFDVDVLPAILEKEKVIYVAKVKAGIVHLFCQGLRGFIRKQNRRILDYYHFESLRKGKASWKGSKKAGLGFFVLSCLTVFPLIWQSVRGFCRRSDRSWFFHPVACWTTLGVYGFAFMAERFGTRREQPRVNWTQ